MPLVLGIDIFVNLLDLLEIRSGNMQVIEGNGIVFLKKGTVQKNVVEFNLFADAQVGLPDQVHRKIHIADHKILVGVFRIADKPVRYARIDHEQIALGNPVAFPRDLVLPLAKHHIGNLNEIVDMHLQIRRTLLGRPDW